MRSANRLTAFARQAMFSVVESGLRAVGCPIREHTGVDETRLMAKLLHTLGITAAQHWRLSRIALLAALSLYADAPYADAPHAASAPSIGDAAPDFALRSLSGQNVRLSEHLGEVVVLNFWGTWCGPCRQEMPRLDEIYKKYRRAGLVLLSVNLDDDSERAGEMAKTLEVSYPVLLDQHKEVARAFDVGTLPVTVLIDRAGVVRYMSGGYKPGYEKRYTERLRELLNE
jgi:peroxiredoxin